MADARHVPNPDDDWEFRTFNVIAETSQEAIRSPGIPSINDEHPVFWNRVVVRVEAKQLAEFIWCVTVHYDAAKE